jgi:hypothetical protein
MWVSERIAKLNEVHLRPGAFCEFSIAPLANKIQQSHVGHVLPNGFVALDIQ